MRGIVASGHELTSAAAAEVMRAGGNACDAVIAGLLTATVTEPLLASPAGGGFVLTQDAGGTPTLHDFFGNTPGIRNPDSALYPIHGDFGDATQEFHIGLGSVAVPGFVAGIHAVHAAHCHMPLPELTGPALRHAREGIVLNEFQARVAAILAPIVNTTSELSSRFRLPDGDRYRDPELADFLEYLAHEPARWFYEGEPAEAIATQCRDGGGHLSLADLKAYRVIRRRPLSFDFAGHRIETNPIPSCGGSLIAHTLGVIGRTPLRKGSADSPEFLLLLARALAETNRARHAVRLQHRHDEDAVAELLATQSLDAIALELKSFPRARGGTTHISAIDADGNIAAATVSNGEGCGYLVPGTGVHLNNFLGEEDLNPDGPGCWQPGIRMSSMMAPTMVTRPNGQRMILGSGGSNRLRTAIAQTIIHWAAFSQPIDAAIAAPRMHVEGGVLNIEAGIAEAARPQLRAAFPENVEWSGRSLFFGGVQAAGRGANGALFAAADDRRGGATATA